jgi:aspartyl-tRNA(Asn)/glutamyl-tRNA(Gln) amidotransferase subunit B
MEYRVIVGLEIHVHLCTKTKMFCGCALEYAIMVAMALNCEIAEFTKWDRKSYYYPDLPKNYQISQYDLPLSANGFIEIPLVGAKTKRIGIIRAHLEEDAGKNLHPEANFSQVDLNRAGTPLLEIVTEPDMSSASEVRALAVELQRIVRYLGVSEGDMQKGHMRFEPNVNLIITKNGTEYKTPIVEVKNLNSFRALERSVEYEVQRQLDEFAETGKTIETGNKTTRGWLDEREVTILQREKEEAPDYRYFPEPDLVPVKLTKEWLADIRGRLCEMPIKRQMRCVTEYKLSDYDAGVLTAERATAEFFEQAVAAGGEPKRICNLLTQTGLKIANEKGCSVGDLGITPEGLAELAGMVEGGTVSSSAAVSIFEAMVESGKGPGVLAEELDLIQKSDAGELEVIVDQVLAENPEAVDDVKSSGKKSKKARGFLLGQVMQKTKGQANPKVVSEILDKKLG